MEMPTISQTGRCHCGAVEYKVDGQILFNGLCHCKDCAHARGSSPVHVLAVTPASAVQVTKGEDKIVTHGDKMTRSFCGTCGTLIHQGLAAANFRGVMPATFHLEGKLPKEYLPQNHVNYESRQWDWNDNLPKYKGFAGGPKMTNDGEVL